MFRFMTTGRDGSLVNLSMPWGREIRIDREGALEGSTRFVELTALKEHLALTIPGCHQGGIKLKGTLDQCHRGFELAKLEHDVGLVLPSQRTEWIGIEGTILARQRFIGTAKIV
jgi:hypothetical protein